MQFLIEHSTKTLLELLMQYASLSKKIKKMSDVEKKYILFFSLAMARVKVMMTLTAVLTRVMMTTMMTMMTTHPAHHRVTPLTQVQKKMTRTSHQGRMRRLKQKTVKVKRKKTAVKS